MKTTLIALALLTQIAFAQTAPPSGSSRRGPDSATTNSATSSVASTSATANSPRRRGASQNRP